MTINSIKFQLAVMKRSIGTPIGFSPKVKMPIMFGS